MVNDGSWWWLIVQPSLSISHCFSCLFKWGYPQPSEHDHFESERIHFGAPLLLEITNCCLNCCLVVLCNHVWMFNSIRMMSLCFVWASKRETWNLGVCLPAFDISFDMKKTTPGSFRDIQCPQRHHWSGYGCDQNISHLGCIPPNIIDSYCWLSLDYHWLSLRVNTFDWLSIDYLLITIGWLVILLLIVTIDPEPLQEFLR